MDTVAEVTVRLGDTLLDVARVGPGACYRIGTAPGLDLPLIVATEFPLVESTSGGYVVRRPAGVRATVDGRRMPLASTELRLGPDAVVELVVDGVTITVRRVPRAVAPLAKRPQDRRPYAYTAGSLIAHLALVLVAIALVDPIVAAVPERPRAIHATVSHTLSDPPKPKPDPPLPTDEHAHASQPSAPPPPSASKAGGGRRGRAIAQAREAGVLGAEGLGDFSSLVSHVNLQQALADATAYDEGAAEQQGFGGGTRLDLGGTIPTGPYETVSDGHGAGDDYDLAAAAKVERHDPVLAMCSAQSACSADGPITTAVIKDVIGDRARALIRCYTQRSGDPNGIRVVLAFEIDRDGTVLRPSARGPAEITGCILGILEKIDFPIATAQTTVTFPLSIGPS